ncbi:unnamed protein product [Paramecium octaurelia]|uniref:Uncharacterized protein n=1 Tax=Paramecium octaurelia TaxID=43137 RepID=A0A8S1TKD6_PAROT|nr:unnamed protein product [Paramecium octaurelia]
MDDNNKLESLRTAIIRGMIAFINSQQQEDEEKIVILNTELNKLKDNQALTKHQKEFYKAKYSQQLLENLSQTGKAKPISIPHVNQIINEENVDVLFYTLKESLLRDQNLELLKTDSSVYAGLQSLIGALGQDQGCLKFRTTQIDYNQLTTDDQFRNQYLSELKQKIAQNYNIKTDQVQVVAINKGSTEILLKIISSRVDIENLKEDDIKFFKNVCGGSIDYYNYFVQAVEKVKVGLSYSDFNPHHNMRWDNFPKKEERGPPGYRYHYYFPKGCQGFGLKLDENEYKNMNWIKMDGNEEEWRILFHGTKQHCVAGITKDKLKGGQNQVYENDICEDRGRGIYFSDKIKVCLHPYYASPVQVGQKQFSVIFMSRANPTKIRQSPEMKKERYFVVNYSADVRPYRILLKEV